MTAVLGNVVQDLLCRVILKYTMDKCTNLYKMLQLDLTDKNIRKPLKNIDIGFAAKLKIDKANKSNSGSKALVFKREAGEFIVGLLTHLLEKSPLRSAIVRAAASINPIVMVDQSKRCLHF